MSKKNKQTTAAVEQTAPVAAPEAAQQLVTPAVEAPEAKAEDKAKAEAEREAKAKAKAEAKAAAKAAREAALAEAHAEVRRLREAEAARRSCLCGCGASTPTAFFVPGHDAKLVSALLAAKAEPKAA